MYARTVEQAEAQLRELRHQEKEDLGLAALVLGLALAATQVRPSLAAPLLVGAVALAILAARAFWGRWELLDRLVLEPDAYTIPEVHAYAEAAATMERRHELAASIRSLLKEGGFGLAERMSASAEELDTLASELDDAELGLDPAAAVVCARLITDPSTSPLFNRELPPEDVPSRIHQIRSGFERRDPYDELGEAA